MHLYTFDDLRLGAGTGNGRLVDVTSVVGLDAPGERRMATLIGRWPDLRESVARRLEEDPGIPVDQVVLRAPLAPRTVVAAPVNYRRHQAEMGGSDGVYKDAVVRTIETYAGFIKASSSVIGPDEAIRLPFADRRFDHEAEVGVVIGRRTSSASRDGAMNHVFGYVPLLDITMRGPEDRSYRKSFDTFTPIGPAIVTADEVPDPADIDFELLVNGELRQRANTRDLIYDIPRLVELFSSGITLEPGDLIATGTPEGVGEIQPGDQILLSISRIGVLEMSTRAREHRPATSALVG